MKLFSRSRRDVPARRRADRLERVETDSSRASQRVFLRNRTISSIQHDPVQPSERERAHHLAARRRRAGMVLGLVAGACVLILLFLLQFTTRINIVVSQTVKQQIDPASYVDTLNQYYANHPVERLRFVLTSKQLNEFVTSRHPEIESIEQTTEWAIGDTTFSITLRKPVAGWEIGSNQYYVDASGVAFEENYFEVPSVQIIDQSGVALEQGTAVTSTRFLGFIGKLVSLAGDRGYDVTEVTLPLETTRQVNVRLQSIRPYIKFSIDRGVGEQVEDMDRALDYLRTRNIQPQYVDVRVEARAFY